MNQGSRSPRKKVIPAKGDPLSITSGVYESGVYMKLGCPNSGSFGQPSGPSTFPYKLAAPMAGEFIPVTVDGKKVRAFHLPPWSNPKARQGVGFVSWTLKLPPEKKIGDCNPSFLSEVPLGQLWPKESLFVFFATQMVQTQEVTKFQHLREQVSPSCWGSCFGSC